MWDAESLLCSATTAFLPPWSGKEGTRASITNSTNGTQTSQMLSTETSSLISSITQSTWALTCVLTTAPAEKSVLYLEATTLVELH